jgi:hypothetical protein
LLEIRSFLCNSCSKFSGGVEQEKQREQRRKAVTGSVLSETPVPIPGVF